MSWQKFLFACALTDSAFATTSKSDIYGETWIFAFMMVEWFDLLHQALNGCKEKGLTYSFQACT